MPQSSPDPVADRAPRLRYTEDRPPQLPPAPKTPDAAVPEPSAPGAPVPPDLLLAWEHARERMPMSDWVLQLDAEGRVRHFTTRARRMLAYHHDQHIDPCFFSHVHPKNLYRVMRDVAEMVSHGRKRAWWRLRLRTGEGRWRWFKVLAQNRFDRPGAAIVLLLRNIEAESAEQALTDAR